MNMKSEMMSFFVFSFVVKTVHTTVRNDVRERRPLCSLCVAVRTSTLSHAAYAYAYCSLDYQVCCMHRENYLLTMHSFIASRLERQDDPRVVVLGDPAL